MISYMHVFLTVSNYFSGDHDAGIYILRSSELLQVGDVLVYIPGLPKIW